MGVSHSPAELAAKMAKLGQAVQKQDEVTVKQAAAMTKKIIVATAASRGVSPSSKIGGRKWSVVYNIKGTEKPTAVLFLRGNFHLVESDTRAHVIGASRWGTRAAFRKRTAQIALRSGGLGLRLRSNVSRSRTGEIRQRNLKSALKINGEFAVYAYHRGTKGKHIFRDSKKAAEKAIPLEYERRIRKAMTAAIR